MNVSGWESTHFVWPSDLQRVWGEILKDWGEEAWRLQEKEEEKEARRSLRLRGGRTELMKRADYPR